MALETPLPTAPSITVPVTYYLALSMSCTFPTSSVLHWLLLADALGTKRTVELSWSLSLFFYLSFYLSFSTPSLAGFSWRHSCCKLLVYVAKGKKNASRAEARKDPSHIKSCLKELGVVAYM